MDLTHVNKSGAAQMVDVGQKPVVYRQASASAVIRMQPHTITLIKDNSLKKGDVLAVARIAGICGGKKTSDLIPLCHPLPIDHIDIGFDVFFSSIKITAFASCTAKTGIEMEVLTAASIAALTIYDMCKAVDKTMTIGDIVLEMKKKDEIHSEIS
jgi:cyclic pyranopterin phosphate synthase